MFLKKEDKEGSEKSTKVNVNLYADELQEDSQAEESVDDKAPDEMQASQEEKGKFMDQMKERVASLGLKEGLQELVDRVLHGKKEEEETASKLEPIEVEGEEETALAETQYDEDGNLLPAEDAEEALEGDGEADDESEEDEMNRLIMENTGKKTLTKKQWLIRGGIAAALTIGVLALVFFNINGDSGEKAYVESVRVITGLGSANGMANRYTGIVEAQDSWDVTLDDGMVVDECYVKVGDEVKTGDKLFKYNTEELTLSKEKLELEVSTLESENTQLNKDITTYQTDMKNATAREKIQLQTDILTAQTTIKKNQYTIKNDKETIESLQKNIKDATVTSKMDGVVKSVNKQLENSGSDMMEEDYEDMSSQNGIYMTILAVGDYRIKGKISETNVWELSEGDEMIVRSRVDENKVWHGTVESIKTDTTSGSEESSNEEDYYYDEYSGESASSYDFFVELEDSSDLMMGQHVLIEVNYGQENDVEGIWLPSVYIHQEENKFYVWKANSHDRLSLVEIEVGDYDEELEQYQVLSGLDIDDYIACDAENLKEGMHITKTDPAESTADADEEFDEEFMGEDEESYYYEGSDDGFDDEDVFSEDYSDDYYDGEEGSVTEY